MAKRQTASIKGGLHASSAGYKGVRRMGSKWGWEYNDGRSHSKRGGFDSAEEAAYNYDEYLIGYIGPDADTNQALGILKPAQVLAIRTKLHSTEKPVNKADKRHYKIGASGFRGVSKASSKTKPWKAQVTVNSKYVAIGTYKTDIEAARAYDAFIMQHNLAGLVTNVSLGLLPPIGTPGKTPNVVPIKPEMKSMLPDSKPKTRGNRCACCLVYKQPDEFPADGTNYICIDCADDAAHTPYKPFLTAEEERLAQIEAARQMKDEEESEEAIAPTVVATPPEPESNTLIESDVSFMGEPPASIPSSTELLVLSDADRMREQAAKLLKMAAEAEAGDIKAKMLSRLDVLSATTNQIQTAMLSLIDLAAAIETEVQALKRSITEG